LFALFRNRSLVGDFDLFGDFDPVGRRKLREIARRSRKRG